MKKYDNSNHIFVETTDFHPIGPLLNYCGAGQS